MPACGFGNLVLTQERKTDMKAPDKIYAGTITEGFGISKRWQVCRNYLENPVEYIRKDLLLEWLEAKVYEHNEDKFDDGFNTAIGQVIDKINSI